MKGLSIGAGRLFGSILVATPLVSMTGCAVYYHDPNSGIDHIWGIGHLESRPLPSPDGRQVTARRATLTGASLGVEDGNVGFSLGYDRRERIDFFSPDAEMLLQRPPDDDYLLFGLGTPAASSAPSLTRPLRQPGG